MSLHNRLTLLIVLCSAAVMAISAAVALELNRERMHAYHREKVGLVAEILGNGLRTLMLEGRGREFQRFMETMVAEDIEAIRIFTENGTILNSTLPGEAGRRVPREYMIAYQGGADTSVYVARREGREVYTQIVSIRNDLFCQRCHGAKETIRGILDVELSGHDTDERLAVAGRKTLAVAFAALVGLGFLVRMLVIRLVKRPLDVLVTTVGRYSGPGGADGGAGPEGMEYLDRAVTSIIDELQKSRDDLSRCTIDKNLHVERMASIGELAAAVAHGIKNPLAGISGALQVLAEDFPADSPRKEIADEVLSEIGRLDTAVKDLLFYARPPELNLIPTDVNAIIEKVRHILEPEAARQKVAISVMAEAGMEIMMDAELMEKAMVNIGAHCIQSMESGGELAISARASGGGVEITVSDAAPPIPQERLGEVFKPFFSTKHSGTGLGLAISRNIIENHKGEVTVECGAGRGNVFRIALGKG